MTVATTRLAGAVGPSRVQIFGSGVDDGFVVGPDVFKQGHLIQVFVLEADRALTVHADHCGKKITPWMRRLAGRR